MRLFGREFKVVTTEVKEVLKEKIVIEVQPFTLEQKEYLRNLIEDCFKRNKMRTRLSCWYCDRSIDERLGYNTWLGLQLHTDCSELFREKVTPVIRGMSNKSGSHLWEGLPIFSIKPVESKEENKDKKIKDKSTPQH